LGLLENVLSDPGAQTSLRYHVDPALQQILQVHEQATQIQDAAARIKFNQEIDIACGSGLTTGGRAKNPQSANPMAVADLEDFLSLS